MCAISNYISRLIAPFRGKYVYILHSDFKHFPFRDTPNYNKAINQWHSLFSLILFFNVENILLPRFIFQANIWTPNLRCGELSAERVGSEKIRLNLHRGQT